MASGVCVRGLEPSKDRAQVGTDEVHGTSARARRLTGLHPHPSLGSSPPQHPPMAPDLASDQRAPFCAPCVRAPSRSGLAGWGGPSFSPAGDPQAAPGSIHFKGVSNLLASLGYAGRRVVLDHTLNTHTLALAGEAQWIEGQPVNRKVAGWIPSRARAWVVGQAPRWGRARGNRSMCLLHMDVCLSLSPSVPLSLKKNE